MLKAIYAQEDKQAMLQKIEQIVEKFRSLKMEKAARIIHAEEEGILSFYEFPPNHWRHIRKNNPLERINWEIRRRTREVRSFSDGHSALMPVAARLHYLAGKKWGTERYMSTKTFRESTRATFLRHFYN